VSRLQYVTLHTGVSMPMVGLGTYMLQGESGEQSMLAAVNAGYRLLDTAQMYGNEREVGNVIRRCQVPRQELFITTKLYRPSASYREAKRDIEKSLAALQTEYIDLLLIHEPYEASLDMYRAMTEAYQAGTVKALGISNFNTSQYLEFIDSCGVIPVVNQVEAHVFHQQGALQEVLRRHGTHMQAWSPFAAGKENFFHNAVLQAIGTRYNKSVAQTGLQFLIQQGISVIPKSSHPDRMRKNMDIFDFELSASDIEKIKALDTQKSLFGWY
jgi:diketogulonate reductase-like aldo/keto reductase